MVIYQSGSVLVLSCLVEVSYVCQFKNLHQSPVSVIEQPNITQNLVKKNIYVICEGKFGM